MTKMLPLTKEELNSQQNAKVCYICGKATLKKLSKSINYWKVIDHSHYTCKHRDAFHSICNLKFNVPNKIPVVFHNGSNFNYYFILANEFEQKFECLAENTEKNKTFTDTIEKEVTEIDKGGNESVVTISYKIKFFDSARIMATSLSNSVH